MVIFICNFQGVLHSLSKSVLSVSKSYVTNKRATFFADVALYGSDAFSSGFIEISYDPKVLKIEEELVFGEALNEFLVSSHVEEEGVLRVAFANSMEKVGEGTLFQIPFRLEVENGISDITVEKSDFYNLAYQSLNIQTKQGGVSPLGGDIKDIRTGVSPNKEWKVRFNKSLHKSTVNDRTVQLFAQNGAQIPCDVGLLDSTTIEVKPQRLMTKGSYTLIVTERVMASNGLFLQKPVQMKFMVE